MKRKLLKLTSKSATSKKQSLNLWKKLSLTLTAQIEPFQILAAGAPILATVAAGFTTGYSAIFLPQLQSNDSTIRITNDEASWIASLAAFGMLNREKVLWQHFVLIISNVRRDGTRLFNWRLHHAEVWQKICTLLFMFAHVPGLACNLQW